MMNKIVILIAFLHITVINYGQTCNNWLKIPTTTSNVTIGDLDVIGNQITIEASFNADFDLATLGYASDIVSKHSGSSDCNYLLRPQQAIVSTTNGFYVAFTNCQYVANKTYHVALVYNGSTLKFYRNGFLLHSIPASGNLLQNNFLTKIGDYAPGTAIETTLGYINEVRIWNVARTQAQLQTYMNASLPNPTTQSGLLGYYVFDNLQNKQGNAAYNGTLNGGAAINATNTSCTFQADSCGLIVNTPTTDTIILNKYTPVLAFEPCKNIITVGNASEFVVGDTVLMIQMKGAVIDSTNTANFGTVTDYKSAGNYEYNYIKSITGNQIELRNKILRTYEIPDGKVQLIKVPYFINYTLNSVLTCKPWDGNKGGVLVFNVQNTLTLNNDINVTGRGFKGGDWEDHLGSGACGHLNYFYNNSSILAAKKGEGIAQLTNNMNKGMGCASNGGGGGNASNSGGGGGSNFGKGGIGGVEYQCSATQANNSGRGGTGLVYNNVQNKIFLGGGGGAGEANNTAGSKGGNGGGIIIITTNALNTNNFNIASNGETSPSCSNSNFCIDGQAGGGAGGIILLKTNTILDLTNILCKGGNGTNVSSTGGYHGPGGGGGGGVLWVSNSALPVNINPIFNGGSNGTWVQGSITGGATPGQNGQTLFNLNLPITTVAFKPNIDSIKIDTTRIGCTNFNFNGLGFTNTSPIVNWQWSFGDGATANTQNTTHNYSTGGSYIVKLVVIDANNCKDSITKNVVVNPFNSTITPNSTVCHGKNIQLAATGGNAYNWTPTTFLNNPTIANPIATPTSTIKYYVTITSALGCTKQDSVTITYVPPPTFTLTASKNSLCINDTVSFVASGGNQYTWSPSVGLSASNIANPVGTPQVTTTYTVQIVNTTCNDTLSLSKPIVVNPLPIINATKSGDIDCSSPTVQLTASGANSYTWSPIVGLNFSNIPNPIVALQSSQLYTVKGIDANGCTDSTSIMVNVSNTNNARFLVPSIFTPNNDGVNDCFGVSHWGSVDLKEFSVFNRWGQRVFFTTNPSKCWDGKVAGKLQDNVVFVYQIRAITLCGEVYRKGTIVVAK